MVKAKTIEQHNAEAEKSEVSMYTITQDDTWVESDILCPCGCNLPLLKYEWPITTHARHRVKCQKTKKIGSIITDNTPREIIKEIRWDNMDGIRGNRLIGLCQN